MPSNSAEYQRAYRARQKATQDKPPARDKTEEMAVELETRLKRQRADQRISNPYTDGREDWPELIQQMTQKQRDQILDHPAIKTSKPSRG